MFPLDGAGASFDVGSARLAIGGSAHSSALTAGEEAPRAGSGCAIGGMSWKSSQPPSSALYNEIYAIVTAFERRHIAFRARTPGAQRRARSGNPKSMLVAPGVEMQSKATGGDNIKIWGDPGLTGGWAEKPIRPQFRFGNA
jgi:hypothetical protein